MGAISLLAIGYSTKNSFVNNNLDRRINYTFYETDNAGSENLSADIIFFYVVIVDNPLHEIFEG